MASEINQTFDRIEALLEFPCDFPIKVIGEPRPGFEDTISALVLAHVPEFNSAQMTANRSSTGKYVSLTVNVCVTTREQLQGLYMTLANHDSVRLVI